MSKATFNILGDIVANDADRWFESDLTPGMFIGWLKKQEGDIEININSNGGDVAGGLAIANAIKGYTKGKKTCNVLGVAASMASVIACAGDELTMGTGAFLMVHNPWTVTAGNAEDLRKDADTLDKMRDSILAFYQSKAYGKSADDLKAIMDAETWLNAEDARAFGFLVDDYAGEFKAAASLTRRTFSNAPDGVGAFLSYASERPVPAPADGGDNWEARFKGLSAKFNDLQRRAVADLADAEKRHADALQARDAENARLQTQLDQSAKDLDAANAKLSELGAQIEEGAKALQTANSELAATRDSLKKAEDKAKQLESTRDLLTAGVLTPAPESSYADKMKSAKTPEEREALRAQKRAGKIK